LIKISNLQKADPLCALTSELVAEVSFVLATLSPFMSFGPLLRTFSSPCDDHLFSLRCLSPYILVFRNFLAFLFEIHHFFLYEPKALYFSLAVWAKVTTLSFR